MIEARASEATRATTPPFTSSLTGELKKSHLLTKSLFIDSVAVVHVAVVHLVVTLFNSKVL